MFGNRPLSAVLSDVPEESQKEYLEYLASEIALFEGRAASLADPSLEQVRQSSPKRILDLGCGAGQELMKFNDDSIELKVGADIQFAAGEVFRKLRSNAGDDRAIFINSAGEHLPFPAEFFDLVICRVALPYMNSATAIREVAHVLAPNGLLLLTVHTPKFYLLMMRRRLAEMSLKGFAYPVICFAGGVFFLLTGKQPAGNFWKGKETFHTRSMLTRELNAAGLRAISEFDAEGAGGRTYLIGKA